MSAGAASSGKAWKFALRLFAAERMARFDFTHLPANGDPILRVFQLPPPAIQFLTSHCEASDGIGLVRTLDERRGLIECWVMPDYLEDFEQLIAGIGNEWPIQEIGSEFE